MEEPSVLDILKSRLTPWKGAPIPIPPVEPGPEPPGEPEPDGKPLVLDREVSQQPVPVLVPQLTRPAGPRPTLPWRGLIALLVALAAQAALEPPGRAALTGVLLYLVAAAWTIWAAARGEWTLAPLVETEAMDLPDREPVASLVYRPWLFILSLVLALAAFAVFGGNRFTALNLVVWAAAILALIASCLEPGRRDWRWADRLRSFLNRPQWSVHITPMTLALLAVFALSGFFRFYRLVDVPPEMISDHAEKLLDVGNILNGQTSIFFPRNTGREAFQMYLTAAVAQVFGTGLSFLSLKIGTLLCGLLTLPFFYLLGKELGDRSAGLWAMAFAGIAYWPNLISRIALRFTLYPFFYILTLYFLVRSLQRRSRRDLVLAGLFLGLGLHGYSPFRVVPIVVVAAVGIYLLHHQSSGARRWAATGLLVIALVSLYVFLPLLRYTVDNPGVFSYRVMTRVSSLEQPLPGSPWLIFLENVLKGLAMFAWDNGEVWVISVAHRPVLDIVSGALFHLGVVLVCIRYLRRRHWFDLFTLVSIPILMLPSTLAIAFPGENPSLNRPAAALVPVFLIVGMALSGLLASVRARLGSPAGGVAAAGLGLLLLAWSASANYDLVFKQYLPVYETSSWNTSEMGKVVRAFATSIGSPDTAWLVGYPHWADSRLVGINAGYPAKDLAIWPDQFQATQADPRAKLFMIKPEDQAGLEALRLLYPQGVLQEYQSQVPGKNFLMLFVPPNP